jgi:hypothetical protein
MRPSCKFGGGLDGSEGASQRARFVRHLLGERINLKHPLLRLVDLIDRERLAVTLHQETVPLSSRESGMIFAIPKKL